MDFKELKNALLKEFKDKKIKQPTDEFNIDRLLFYMDIATKSIKAIREEGEYNNVTVVEGKKPQWQRNPRFALLFEVNDKIDRTCKLLGLSKEGVKLVIDMTKSASFTDDFDEIENKYK